MGTRFEIAIHTADPVHARAAGEAALAEVERLHRQLQVVRSELVVVAVDPHGRGPERVELGQPAGLGVRLLEECDAHGCILRPEIAGR